MDAPVHSHAHAHAASMSFPPFAVHQGTTLAPRALFDGRHQGWRATRVHPEYGVQVRRAPLVTIPSEHGGYCTTTYYLPIQCE